MADRSLPRELGHDLRAATDAQLSQVLALIDAMPSRGAADALIANVRPRIAKLRPERPLALPRVLLAPLDPLIVPPRDWRPGAVTMPRSVLSLLSKPVLANLAALRAELESSLQGVWATNTDALLAAGARLWPAAAPVVADLPTPDGWRAQTGLPETEWFELRDSASAILARAIQIESVLADTAGDGALEKLLGAASSCNRASLARLVHILLARHGRPGEVTAILARFQEPSWRVAAEFALNNAADEALDLFERTASDSSAAAAAKATQLAAMLDAVDAPARHRRVQEVRTKVSAACQQRLEAVLRDDIFGPLTAPGSGTEGVDAVEQSARAASKLEKASRALDPRSRAQALLRTAATDIVMLRSDALDDVDRVRLVEILLGPEQAMAAAANLPRPKRDGQPREAMRRILCE
jgi:hypothetical protein